jgi:tRNA pseudouridine55 synthase
MDGVINVFKPIGMTSFDVVARVRKIANTKKVGHTGTLDPNASGVLPICIGRATKIVDYIMNNKKTYKTVLKLGIVTDSYDTEGKILSVSEVNVNENLINEAIYSFKGSTLQTPPMYSAIKVNGKKLYELARQGVEIDRAQRPITIYEINIDYIDLPYVGFTVQCSKGTYIRSLCYDIGNILGCGGTMWELQRTSTGNFDIQNSININLLNSENIENYLIPIEKALDSFEKIVFNKDLEKKLLNGVKILDEQLLKNITIDKFYKVYLKDNGFIGIGMRDCDGFKIAKLLL